MTPQNNATLAIYRTHAEAESAIKELPPSGFDLGKLSIIGRDYYTDEHAVGYYNTSDHMKHWGQAGALWGGIWGMLFGSAFFFIPGIGPLLVARPLVGWIVGVLEGAVVLGGLSALSLGIPKDNILQYETAVKSGKYVVIAHGTATQTAAARASLAHTNPESMEQHQPADAAGVAA